MSRSDLNAECKDLEQIIEGLVTGKETYYWRAMALPQFQRMKHNMSFYLNPMQVADFCLRFICLPLLNFSLKMSQYFLPHLQSRVIL